jgi:hypothetical protein
MHKLSRFQSFASEAKEETQGKRWRQKITLPLQPEVYAAYKKQQAEAESGKKNAGQARKGDNPRLGNEHILSALGDLIRSLDIDGKEVIDYILNNDLVKGESIDEP